MLLTTNYSRSPCKQVGGGGDKYLDQHLENSQQQGTPMTLTDEVKEARFPWGQERLAGEASPPGP